MQLWSGTLSPFSAKVRMTLAEMSLDYELRELPWTRASRWEPKPSECLAVSPRAEVPVLVVDNQAIFDSTIIIEYLAETYPERALLPREPMARAQCRMWEDQADLILAQPVVSLIQEVFLKPDESQREQQAVAAATESIGHYHQQLEAQLSSGDYLLGEFTVADIANFIAVGFAQTLGVAPSEELRQLQAWRTRLFAREALATDFSQMMQAAAAA